MDLTCSKRQNRGRGEICGFQGLEVKKDVTKGHMKGETLLILVIMSTYTCVNTQMAVLYNILSLFDYILLC